MPKTRAGLWRHGICIDRHGAWVHGPLIGDGQFLKGALNDCEPERV